MQLTDEELEQAAFGCWHCGCAGQFIISNPKKEYPYFTEIGCLVCGNVETGNDINHAFNRFCGKEAVNRVVK